MKEIPRFETFTYDDGYIELTKYNGHEAVVTIPNEIYSIKDRVFTNKTFVQDIMLNDNLHWIGDLAFANTGITEILFTENVQYIGSGVVSRCDIKSIGFDCISFETEPYTFTNSNAGVEEIYYAGTVEQWRALQKKNKTIVNLIQINEGHLTVFCKDKTLQY